MGILWCSESSLPQQEVRDEGVTVARLELVFILQNLSLTLPTHTPHPTLSATPEMGLLTTCLGSLFLFLFPCFEERAPAQGLESTCLQEAVAFANRKNAASCW